HPSGLGGIDLPAGVVAAHCIYLTHRRPDVWEDAQRFDPERFLARKPGPYEFIPFGGGTRHCLGAAFAMYEMKIVLAEMLQRVEEHDELDFSYLGDQAPDVAERLRTLRMPASRGIAGAVLRDRTPVRVDDARTDSRFYPDVDRATGLETRGLLCVPLLGPDA